MLLDSRLRTLFEIESMNRKIIKDNSNNDQKYEIIPMSFTYLHVINILTLSKDLHIIHLQEISLQGKCILLLFHSATTTIPMTDLQAPSETFSHEFLYLSI